jgi:hypothetical protein
MTKGFSLILLFILVIPPYSCRKMQDYFRNPDTEYIAENLNTAILTGYAAGKAMAVMEGVSFPNMITTRSNSGFPCTTTMVLNLAQDDDFVFSPGKSSAITIAGLWADSTTAILTMLFTDFHAGTNTLDLIGIETIPVIREGYDVRVVLADMDISLNPDQSSILSINLTDLEVQSELLRLDMPRPADVYVAVSQKAYFVDMDMSGTWDDFTDDTYEVTGGGQLVEVAGNSAEIVQQAMVEVQVSPDCFANPVNGMALIKVTGVEDEGFPELGTALLQFHDQCDGEAEVLVATGMYIGSNGQHISFR